MKTFTCLCIISLLNICYAQQLTQPKKIAFIEWGSHANSVGFEKDDSNYGPGFFEVLDDNSVYISDDVNNKIKVFKNNQNIREVLPEDGHYVSRIKVLPDNNLLYDNGHALVLVNEDGNILQKLSPEDYPGIGMRHVELFNDRVFIQGIRNDVYIFDIRLNQVEDKISLSSLPYPAFIFSKGEFYFYNKKSDPSNIQLRKVRYTDTEKLNSSFLNTGKKLMLPKQEGLFAMRAVDNDGNIYVSYKEGIGKPFRFVKYNTDMQKVGEIFVKLYAYHEIAEPFKFSSAGDLFVLCSSDKGVWVDKYATELFK